MPYANPPEFRHSDQHVGDVGVVEDCVLMDVSPDIDIEQHLKRVQQNIDYYETHAVIRKPKKKL